MLVSKETAKFFIECTAEEAWEVDSVMTPQLITDITSFPDVTNSEHMSDMEMQDYVSEMEETVEMPIERMRSDLCAKQGWLHKKFGWSRLSLFQKRW